MEKKLNEKVREQKAITLIALVITIIVLLILASVSIAMLTGENGILTKASTAKETNAQKTAEEQVKLAIIGSYGQDGKINLVELKENLSEISGITGVPDNITESNFPFDVTLDGQKIEVSKTGDTVTAEVKVGTIPSTPETPTYTAYSVGDTFTVGGETFYVIEASDVNTEIVKGLAEKNIGVDSSDTATYLKQSDNAGKIVFSNTNYWSSETSYPVNLNNYVSASIKSTDVIEYAKAYGATKGATGRLMTVEEAYAITGLTSSGTISSPNWIKTPNYWLGSARNASYVWRVYNGTLSSYYFSNVSSCGVRPVIEISKSLIS